MSARKLLKYFLARIANVDGNRGNDAGGTSSAGTENESTDILADDMGKVIVRLADNAGYVPVPFPVDVQIPPEEPGFPVVIQNPSVPVNVNEWFAPNNSEFPDNFDAESVSSVPSKIFGIYGTNNSAFDLWFQIFDLGAAPITAVSIPQCTFKVNAGQNISFEPSLPINFNNGIAIAWSLTSNIYTETGVDIGSAFVQWGDQ